MKEKCVEQRIVEAAESKIEGKYNLVQFKKEKAKMMAHRAVCQSVIAFSKENVHIPMYVILSAGISAGAFKNAEFEKGYKRFNPEKVKAVFEMAKAYNAAMGKDCMPSDVLYRVAMKYYKEVSTNVEDFKNSLKKAKKMSTERGNFVKLCENVGIY